MILGEEKNNEAPHDSIFSTQKIVNKFSDFTLSSIKSSSLCRNVRNVFTELTAIEATGLHIQCRT
jgi:hypothetical protein